MIALSNGFVFDTDKATLVAKYENGNGLLKIYRTENDRYFSYFQPSESFIEEQDGEEMITHLEDGYDEFEELIEELTSSCTCEVCGERGTLSVYFDEFPKG